MYTDYFGIDENPFSISPDPRYLYMSKRHQEALAHMLYGVGEGGGFVLLSGEVGTGKTTICRCLMEQMPDTVDLALILNPRLSEVELLATTCDELGIPYPKGTESLKLLGDILNRHLLDAHARGRRSVLIIDEAQNLTPEVLEQVRLLTNLETVKTKLLQIILIGQPELNELLSRKELRQLAQRITARCHLEPLSSAETKAYIHHRLAVGGLETNVFDSGAIAEVFKRSGGVPRLINSVCDRSLLGAYTQNRKTINRRMVSASADEVFGKSKSRFWKNKILAPLAAAAAAAAITFGFVYLDPLNLGISPRNIGDKSNVQIAETPGGQAAQHPGPSAEKPQPVNGGGATAAPVEGGTSPAQTESATAETSKQNTAESSVNEETAPVAEAQQETVTAKTEPSGDTTETTPPEQAPETEQPVNGGDKELITEAADVATTGASVSTSAEKPQSEIPAEPQVAAVTSAAPMPDVPKELTAENLFDHPDITGDLESALVTLFGKWKRNYHQLKGFAPCTRASTGGLQCLQGHGTWRSLYSLNRPALIDLSGPGNKRINAVITAISNDTITMELNGRTLITEAELITPYWSGDFLILWKPPSVYFRDIHMGFKGKDVAWFNKLLDEANGVSTEGAPGDTFDAAMQEKVLLFQKNHSLTSDGIIGVRTLIALNTVTLRQETPLLRDGE